MPRSVVSGFFLFFFLHFGICGTIVPKTEPALLIISYDAFRPEYLTRKVTPNLNKFGAEGVSAQFMLNVFPTKTFVNHFTIATGLYAGRHGVLANELYDSKLAKLMEYSYEMFHYSNETIPIWIANEKAGKNSGCMMWPGSDFDYNGISCTFTEKFNNKMKWEIRVDTALSWFQDEKTPANLVLMYIEEPDADAHIFGPESNVITNIVARLDNLTQYIQDKLIQTGLDKRVNVIHMSDHGMNSVTPPNFIDLTKFVASNVTEMYGTSPVLQIVPTDTSKETEIFMNLTRAAKANGHFKVYNKNNIPARWHASNDYRLGPILAVADVGFGFQDLMATAKSYEKKYNIKITNKTKYGVHGYDNEELSMHAIFLAKGPLFAKHKKLKAVNMIDMYNLFCLILNIKCYDNDGSTKHEIWDELFSTQQAKLPAKEAAASSTTWALIFVFIVVVLFSSIVKIRQLRRDHVINRNRELSRCILTDFEVLDDETILQYR